MMLQREEQKDEASEYSKEKSRNMARKYSKEKSRKMRRESTPKRKRTSEAKQGKRYAFINDEVSESDDKAEEDDGKPDGFIDNEDALHEDASCYHVIYQQRQVESEEEENPHAEVNRGLV